MSPREKKVNRASTVCRVILQLFRFYPAFYQKRKASGRARAKDKGAEFSGHSLHGVRSFYGIAWTFISVICLAA